jgi:hypothetical protein
VNIGQSELWKRKNGQSLTEAMGDIKFQKCPPFWATLEDIKVDECK